ncbi:MAG TPA: exodeoxyribonuclease VII large subunit [Solirubrobacteraceae bacterium]|jgi:exodeoxyribonuclease VII large subunit|nr:exodeoxyribonuclease VII large subunit [Solirubrobacteraceae bacterium]
MQQLAETQTATALSVAQLAARVGSALRALGDGWVEGEVTQISLHRGSGHVYLTLADESASVDACIWKGRVSRCHPLPAQGDLVQAHFERVDFYAPRGSTKLIVDRINPTGEGELLRRRAQTLQRLRADGLCDPDRRKPLPAFPRRVGVIAARNDANVDVIQALRKRFPPQDVVFCAASVQGVHAVGSVIDALGRLQALDGVDVIVLARGGGSTADLVAFDDERLCRAIFACAKPVITSIGHTKDRPNCDHVAAAFAPVPAKAPELAIRHSADELLGEMARATATLARVRERVVALREGTEQLWAAVRPARALDGVARELSRHGQLAHTAVEREVLRRGAEVVRAGQMLDATRRAPMQSIELASAQLHATRRRAQGELADLLAAIARRTLEIETRLRPELSRRAERMAAEAARLAPAADRILSRDRERLHGLLAVLRARDFRRNGWTVATDDAGQAVGSVAQLAAGSELTLHLVDGTATVTTKQIEKEALDG